MKTHTGKMRLGHGVWLLVFLGMGMVGCEAASPALVSRCTDFPAVTQSRVFYTPQHRALTSRAFSSEAGATSPWYASRNDRQLSVLNGYQRASRERIVIDTQDRQQTYDGRVLDYYNQRTRIRQTTTIVR